MTEKKDPLKIKKLLIEWPKKWDFGQSFMQQELNPMIFGFLFEMVFSHTVGFTTYVFF